MIIWLENYEFKRKIASLALSEDAFEKLKVEKVNIMYLHENKIYFWPEESELELSEENKIQFLQSDNYDVFQISEDGRAFLYYNNEIIDNALMVTNKCNSNCIMCPVADNVRKKEADFSATELLEIIRHIPSDPIHLTVTGGEPFLIGKSFFEILAEMKTKFTATKFLLLTNGRALSYKPFLDRFRDTCPVNTVIGIPLHGYNAVTHDRITRSEGGFHQTILGIKGLLYYGYTVELRIVVSKLNSSYIGKIADLIIDEMPSVSSVKIMGLEMLGNAAKNTLDVWIPYQEAFQAARLGIDKLINKGIDIALYNFPLCAVEKEYHLLCVKSITDYKIRYADECDDCILKDACGGIFSGTIRLAEKNVIPWRI